MNVNTNITIDLVFPRITPPIVAMQNDSGTRTVTICLMENGVAWEIPDDALPMVVYSKPSGVSGRYDTVSGKSAFAVDGSKITVTFASQLLTCPGLVTAAVVFHSSSGQQLSTFPFAVDVRPSPNSGGVPEDTGSVDTFILPSATVEQTADGAIISITDKNGTTTATVNNGKDGKSAYQYAQDGGYTGTEKEFAAKLAGENAVLSDWNAAEGEPGHIANRTHWVGEPVTKVLLEATFSGEYEHAGLIGLTEGVVYDVTYNGQLYKCKCEKVTTIHPTIGSTLHGYAIGNIAAFTGTGNTGEPFVIGDIPTIIYEGTLYLYNTAVVMQLRGDGSASIRVSVTTQETHKIDPVYLPESTHGPVAVQVPLDINAVEPSFATVVSANPDITTMYPAFYVKVSDLVLSEDELRQCMLVHNTNGNAFSVSLVDSKPDDDGSRLNYGMFFTVVYDAANSQEFAAGGNGIYFLYSEPIKTLRLYSDTVTMPGVEYRKIPAQYLPGLTAVAVTQADYDALAAAGQADENTLYVITG